MVSMTPAKLTLLLAGTLLWGLVCGIPIGAYLEARRRAPAYTRRHVPRARVKGDSLW